MKWSELKVVQLCLTLCDPMDYTVPEILQGVGSLSFLQGNLSNSGIELRSPTLWVDSLPGEPQGEPKNTEVGSLSLLHRIFPTQELNQGFLHCRWILCQLSYQGNPIFTDISMATFTTTSVLLLKFRYLIPKEHIYSAENKFEQYLFTCSHN